MPLSVEYGVYVKWPESEIGADPVIINCPCGKLNATQYGSPQLSRVCGGSYTYGAQWKEVDATQCNYTDNTYKLCSVTQVRLMCPLQVNWQQKSMLLKLGSSYRIL